MSQLTNVWVFSDNVEHYSELMTGARQWGQQVHAVMQDDTQVSAVKPLGAQGLYVLGKTAQQRI